MNHSRRVIITRDGFLRLIDRLNYLKHVVRPRVVEELKEARSFGINLNNTQFINAREKHIILEKNIHDLEDKIHRSEILVGCRFYVKRVFIGTEVEIENLETGEVNSYKIVGPYESDVANGRLSSTSPVGRAILGKFEGDVVRVEVPAGTRRYRILSISVP